MSKTVCVDIGAWDYFYFGVIVTAVAESSRVEEFDETERKRKKKATN